MLAHPGPHKVHTGSSLWQPLLPTWVAVDTRAPSEHLVLLSPLADAHTLLSAWLAVADCQSLLISRISRTAARSALHHHHTYCSSHRCIASPKHAPAGRGTKHPNAVFSSCMQPHCGTLHGTHGALHEWPPAYTQSAACIKPHQTRASCPTLQDGDEVALRQQLACSRLRCALHAAEAEETKTELQKCRLELEVGSNVGVQILAGI